MPTFSSCSVISLGFAHRFFAAITAIALRCSFVSFAALATPPFDPRADGSLILPFPLPMNHYFAVPSSIA